MTLHAYPSIYNLGHTALLELFDSPVLVEEKIDGSQFSFGVNVDGTVFCRSKGAEIFLDSPEKMFTKAVNTVVELKDVLTPGYVYRGEYLQKPNHNTICYDRVPTKHIMLFDIERAPGNFLSRSEKETEAQRIGLEIVPAMFIGMIENGNQVRNLMTETSVLGGSTPEGLVIKNYSKFGPDKKILLGKYVTEQFKEVHRTTWKSNNPSQGDILQVLIDSYRTQARWQKSVQHLNERGQLDNSPKDIGALIKEVHIDVEKECVEEIKDALYKWAWPKIQRGITSGLPQWYKDKLLDGQFKNE